MPDPPPMSPARSGFRFDSARSANNQVLNQSSRGDSGRSSQRFESTVETLSRLPSLREAAQLLAAGDQREVKINELVGNGISG